MKMAIVCQEKMATRYGGGFGPFKKLDHILLMAYII